MSLDSSRFDRIAGSLYGALIGDALALGAHWIYDQQALARQFGQVTDFRAPAADSYHPTKRRGQQTHYGDQTLTLLDSVQASGGFSRDAFAQSWRRMWEGYPDYFDHATKDTLAKLEAGIPPAEAASTSNELGGAARLAPLLAVLADEPLDAIVAAARAQTSLTHAAPIAGDAAEFLARAVSALYAGDALRAALEKAGAGRYAELDLAAIRKRIDSARALETGAAVAEMGLACPAPQALPAVLLLLDRSGDDFETALIENVMAGGDNAARGLALGTVLGASVGRSRLPERWQHALEAAPRLDAFLAMLAQREELP